MRDKVWLLIIAWDDTEQSRSIHREHAAAEREFYRQLEGAYGCEWQSHVDDVGFSIEEYEIQP